MRRPNVLRRGIAAAALFFCISLTAEAATARPLDVIKERKLLIVCADPYNPPFSSPNPAEPGFDVEIAKAISDKLGVKVSFFWVNTGTRGGLGRALRESISADRCDIFMGIGISGDTEEEMEEKGLQFTKPYFSTGFVLVVPQDSADIKSLEDVKDKKVGVEMTTPADFYLYQKGYQRDLFRKKEEALEAIMKGDNAAGYLWAPHVGYMLNQEPEKYKVKILEGYIPEKELWWNIGAVVRKDAAGVKEAVDKATEELLAEGTIKEIISKYGVPYFPAQE